MKTDASENSGAVEVQLELKYCERCGGLWLRMAGALQIYCTPCAREMAKLPPAHQRPEQRRSRPGRKWQLEGLIFERPEEMSGDQSGGE